MAVGGKLESAFLKIPPDPKGGGGGWLESSTGRTSPEKRMGAPVASLPATIPEKTLFAAFCSAAEGSEMKRL